VQEKTARWAVRGRMEGNCKGMGTSGEHLVPDPAPIAISEPYFVHPKLTPS